MVGQALGFALDAAGVLISLGITLEAAKSPPPSAFTSVQIISGPGPDSQAGGNVPHMAIWDDDGNRIGQYHPKKNAKHKEDFGKTYAIEHNQNGGKPADPYYIMLSNLGNDAICISSVTVSNEKISGTFYGDTRAACGQSWFLSETSIGTGFTKPKCVWLDADHSNKINARALSFHLNDMAPNPDKLDQYNAHKETLCKSTPRFSFWGNLLPDGIIPFFKPKLTYNIDSGGAGQGNDTDMARVIDKPGQYDKSVYLNQGEKTRRSTQIKRRSAQGFNKDPGHLIVTDHPGDDVRRVCESETSFGWDIVSTVQNLFCDMEVKQLYPLCDANDVRDNCFNLEGKVVVPKGGIEARDRFAHAISQKNYTSEAYWNV